MSERIRRATHGKQNPYFLFSRDTAQDRTLSFEARGMLAYLLSKPDDWAADVRDLQQECGRDKVYKVLRELVEHGYITDRVRTRSKEGTWQYSDYIVHETPCESTPLPEKPYTDAPYTENKEIKALNTEGQTSDYKIKIVSASDDAPPSFEKSVRPRSEKQQARDAQWEALKAAMKWETVAKTDEKRFGQVVTGLSVLTPAQIERYVEWVRGLAASQRWTFSLNALMGTGRVSQFLSQLPKAVPSAPPQSTTDWDSRGLDKWGDPKSPYYDLPTWSREKKKLKEQEASRVQSA